MTRRNAASRARKPPARSECLQHPVPSSDVIAADELDDRKLRGLALFDAVRCGTVKIALVDVETTIYWSSKDLTRAYSVVRQLRNIRGKLIVVYRCPCEDFKKHGRSDCEHMFAERLRRSEIRIVGRPQAVRAQHAAARRGPPRKRYDVSGRPIRTSQRIAREKMPVRIPDLILSLKEAYERDYPPQGQRPRGRPVTAKALRAVAILLKISEGRSADAMIARYAQLIDEGRLRFQRPPHQNTLSEWINDEELTPVLQAMLGMTSQPFRRREIACIVDSSKLSQSRLAHARLVDYGTDERPGVDWVKAHTLIGVETMIVLGVRFSGTLGKGSHDINFVRDIVDDALRTFDLKFLLGDKAYLSEDVLGWLWEHGIRAAIPLKKRWDAATKSRHYEASAHLVEWYDRRRREFDTVYRLRAKIEGLFSILKRIAGGHCWSRGRPRKDANAIEPCTAWKNELLAKMIFLNLRTTCSLEEETGVGINYLVRERFFPPPSQPLLTAPL